MLTTPCKVLVVEDEALIRFLIADFLQEAGYTVVEAANVLEAVALLGTHEDIAAIITDIDMPGGLDGLDLVKMVQTCRSKMKIVVTSGGHVPANDSLPENARFFSKPYDGSVIVDTLTAMLEDDVQALPQNARLSTAT